MSPYAGVAMIAAVLSGGRSCHAFAPAPVVSSSANGGMKTAALAAVAPPPGGMVAEEKEAGAVGASSSTKRVGINSLGAKMNEIDFTLAPTDVSLSRCYQMSRRDDSTASTTVAQSRQSVQSLSLTRALNTASNRAVRRILLSRSWPSAEALNLSLRTVLMQQQKREEEAAKEREAVVKAGLIPEDKPEEDKAKCPVPRPILNVIMRNRKGEGGEEGKDEDSNNPNGNQPTPRANSASSEERERQWIQNQLAVFGESYSTIPDYEQAEAYLESILCLATSGVESERVAEVFDGGLYVEPYVRILSVIQSVGAVLEEVSDGGSRRQIAKKLIDQDFCLSMLDKISLANERRGGEAITLDKGKRENPLAIPYDAAARLAYDKDSQTVPFEEFKKKYEVEAVAVAAAKWKQINEVAQPVSIATAEKGAEEKEGEPKRKRRLAFWRGEDKGEDETDARESDADGYSVAAEASKSAESASDPPIEIKPDDLGGVLLSAEEPTMTRQLNVLSNIVQRTLIFGGDQELLVLAETLDADKPAFVQRWYDDGNPVEAIGGEVMPEEESRPGVQYLNSLVRLLRDCYAKGVVTSINPPLSLPSSYRNAYGRLTASLIELGSGYVRPASSGSMNLAMTTTAATAKYLTSTAPPKTAREELGRFAKWEAAVRKNRENPYPDDLVGTWSVQDVVGTQTIGTTQVQFKPQGELRVDPPMQGLRWRLDPGPTHLDTCTFQVLSEDGAILQYRGYVDRGSRLEARVSKRSVRMRGGVGVLMRDAELGGVGDIGEDYWDDMVPMNYKSGTTKFIMNRNINNADNGDDSTGSLSGSSATASVGLRGPLKCPPVAEGEREILDGPNGPILVTKVAGSYYAVDATCPHLGLPMKRGKISADDKPTLTCSFHNSCFELRTGKCTKWVTGALGSENDVIAGIMGSVGSGKKDITAYMVMEGEDGSLTVTSEVLTSSKVAV